MERLKIQVLSFENSDPSLNLDMLGDYNRGIIKHDSGTISLNGKTVSVEVPAPVTPNDNDQSQLLKK